MKTIKDMPEHSRPCEKLRERGASALTDEELVAANSREKVYNRKRLHSLIRHMPEEFERLIMEKLTTMACEPFLNCGV